MRLWYVSRLVDTRHSVQFHNRAGQKQTVIVAAYAVLTVTVRNNTVSRR